MAQLTAWSNFYVIAGSAAGALTGLTFVVITLVAGNQRGDSEWGVAAFTTPTIVHFGMVLFICALLSAPWPSLVPAALMQGLSGLAGFVYSLIVVRRLRHNRGYAILREDWLWYAIVPLAAYALLALLAIALPGDPLPTLFGIGGVLLLLLFLGIHNAWDVVTYIVTALMSARDDEREDKGEETPEAGK